MQIVASIAGFMTFKQDFFLSTEKLFKNGFQTYSKILYFIQFWKNLKFKKG